MYKGNKMQNRLKKIREQLNKTQKEMSTLLDLGENTWQNYERGITQPKLTTLEKLNELGFSISWITSNVGVMSKSEVSETNSSFSINSSIINKSKLFNLILTAIKELYENDNLEGKPQNFLENKAFDMVMNISSMAEDDNDALRMLQLLINQEKENLNK